MKTKKRSWIAGLLPVILIALLMAAVAHAAPQDPFNPTKKSGGCLPSTYQRQILSSFWPQGGDYETPRYSKAFTMKAISTNKKVANVKIVNLNMNGVYQKRLSVIPSGVGSTKIQITVQTNGKTYKKTFPYNVYKYTNPFSSFTINNKNYTSKLNKLKNGLKVATGSVRYVDWIPPQGTLKFKPKKDFKILDILAVDKDHMTIDFNIKNNWKIPSDCCGFWIFYENTKTKAYGELFIGKK